MKVLGVIPARGGSKGVPNKNIREIDGKSLIEYAIDCALGSKHLSTIVVNSDSDKVLDIASKYSSTKIISQKRDAYLATDTAKITDVVSSILDSFEDEFDLVVLLQVTAPIRDPLDLDTIIEMFVSDKELDGVVSVVPMDDIHPARMYNKDEKEFLESFVDGGESKRRQDLEPVYYRNGCFYAVTTSYFKKELSLMPKNKKAYIMPFDKMLNIDSPRDIKIAEVLIPAWKKGEL